MAKCVNCGREAEHWHHIIPKSLGGNDGTNVVPLCDKCHGLIHGYIFTDGTISHSALIKNGINKARIEGKQIGGKKGSKYNTKKQQLVKPLILRHSKDFYGKLNDTEVIKVTGISRKTYYKYKKELKEERYE